MGLYLAIFRDEEELDGVEVGSYADFSFLRAEVVRLLEGGKPGTRFPTLILHSDCDGQWTPTDAVALERELEVISREFRQLAPVAISSEWQQQVAKTFGVRITSLYDCFFDVDGEPLLQRIKHLAELSENSKLPILFQ